MEQIKQIRQRIDCLMQESKGLTGNREMALAYTNMQRGSSWLGLALQAIGTADPYPNSTNTGNTIIEDRTDQAKDSPVVLPIIPTDVERVIQIKWLREQLGLIIADVNVLRQTVNLGIHETLIAYDSLREAKMWYGWELNNIHEAAQMN